MPELPLSRLHLMRLGYAVMGVGSAVVKWPVVIGCDRSCGDHHQAVVPWRLAWQRYLMAKEDPWRRSAT